MLVWPIIESRKHVRHVTSQFSLCRQWLFQNHVLELLGLYRAEDLILLLFCAQQILSGICRCHKSRLTYYTWLKSGMWMVKVCIKAFFTETRITVSWLLQVSSPSITWSICWATCSRQLPGKGMPWRVETWDERTSFCSLLPWSGWR